MKKSLFAVVFVAALCGAAAAQSLSPTPYVRPDSGKRFRNFALDLTGPAAWGGIVGGAGLSTALNEPEEWHGTWDGFGKRVASNFGKNIIRSTVTYGLDEALRVDSHFYKSDKRDAGPRIKNALISPVTARRPNGKRTVGVPRIVGTYSANLIAYDTWYPDRYDWKDGMLNGTITLGTNAVYNLVKEFIFNR